MATAPVEAFDQRAGLASMRGRLCKDSSGGRGRRR